MQTRYRKAARGLLATLLLGMVAGCRDGKEVAAPPSPLSSTPVATAPPPAALAPDATATSDAASMPVEPWLLSLDGEGLRIFNSNSGASRLLAFGDDGTQSMAVLGRVLGEPVPVTVDNEECKVGFARWSNGLTVWSSGSRFVGWSVAPTSSALTTTAGLAIGSTRVELQKSYDAKIFESSLGTEFSAGGLAGLLDSPREGAKILNLWAGETCIAR